jgi:hypothetical protein
VLPISDRAQNHIGYPTKIDRKFLLAEVRGYAANAFHTIVDLRGWIASTRRKR